MENLDQIVVEAPGWAQSLELSTPRPVGGEITRQIHVPQGTKVLILTASGSPHTYQAPESLFIDLSDEQGSLTAVRRDDEKVFVNGSDGRVSVVVVNDPRPGSWRLTLRAKMPIQFHVNLVTFRQRLRVTGKWRCRICKMAVGALAAAILAAVLSGITLPAALLAAITAALGTAAAATAAAAVAAAGWVTGMTLEAVAEELCQSAGLCSG